MRLAGESTNIWGPWEPVKLNGWGGEVGAGEGGLMVSGSWEGDSPSSHSFQCSSLLHASLVAFVFILENHNSIMSLILISTVINDVLYSLPPWKTSILPFPWRAPVVKRWRGGGVSISEIRGVLLSWAASLGLPVFLPKVSGGWPRHCSLRLSPLA